MQAPEEKSWLVFADASGVGDALVSRLRELGARCRVATARRDHFEFDGNDAFTLRPGTLEDWQQLVKDCGVSSPERIVYLWNLDAPVNGADMATNLDALLHLTQALESAAPAARLRLDLVTRNAQPGRQRSATDGGGAGAEHRIDACHFERTFQPLAGAPSIFPRNRPRQMRN